MCHLTVLSLLHIEGQDQTATLLFDKKNSLFISVYIYRTYMILYTGSGSRYVQCCLQAERTTVQFKY